MITIPLVYNNHWLFHFINGKCHIKQLKSWKSRKTYLTNHTQSISYHIMPLDINGLRGGHMHILTHELKQYHETRHVHGLKRSYHFRYAVSRMESCTHSPMLQKDCEFSIGHLLAVLHMSHLNILWINSMAKIHNYMLTKLINFFWKFLQCCIQDTKVVVATFITWCP